MNSIEKLKKLAVDTIPPVLMENGFEAGLILEEVRADDRLLQLNLLIEAPDENYIVRSDVKDLLKLIDLDRDVTDYLLGLADEASDIFEMSKDGKMAPMEMELNPNRTRVFIRLQDPDIHAEKLKKAGPVRSVLNGALTATYRIDLSLQKGSVYSTAVDSRLFDFWNLSEEELNRIGMDNLMVREPVLMDLYDLSKISGRFDRAIDYTLLNREKLRTDRIYTLTLDGYWNGASAMLNEDTLRKIGELFGEDYFLLPSSINDVMIYPWSLNHDIEDLKDTLRCGNKETTTDSDILTNKVFRYRNADHILEEV